MPPLDKSNAFDHVVLVLFENRSLDNVLGHLYGPEDGKTFEGVIGKDLSNPIPAWAEHGAERKVVPYTVATDMDSPNPDSGEEHFHTNTQLFNTLDDHNRFKIGDAASAPWNAPPSGAKPTMDGFVTDYISNFTGEIGRQPTYDEYAHIMTGYTPEQLPVLNGIARDFGVFDHWFCEVPSQTFMNRSFWTAATSSGLVVNSPMSKWFTKNDAETIFERLEAHGKTWKVYVMEPMVLSFTGLIHFPGQGRLAPTSCPSPSSRRTPPRARCRTSRSSNRTSLGPRRLPPGHGPIVLRCGGHQGRQPVVDPVRGDLPGPMFDAYRSATSESGTNVWNTALLIGWDEPGGTYDHVAPRTGCSAGSVRARPASAASPSTARVIASPVIVSPWVESGSVYNEEYRHTSLIATLRKLGDRGRVHPADATAPTFDHVFTLDTPANRRPGRSSCAPSVDADPEVSARPQHARQADTTHREAPVVTPRNSTPVSDSAG